jgi:hypothetical protein
VADTQPNGTGPQPNNRGLFALLCFAAMLMGMAAQAGFNHLNGSAPWQWGAFLAPFLISPLIFQGFLAIVRSQIDMLTGILIAFQNGFFWKQIFDGLKPILQTPGVH